jgi:ABC-type glutathione transport system ATPase component
MTSTTATPSGSETDRDVLLDVRGLAVAYRDAAGEEVRLVDDVSFTLRRGETLGLAGESGCGKTTTALSLLGLLPTNLYRAAGEVTLNSERGVMHIDRRTDRGFRDLRWRNVSIIFQGAMNALDPVMRVSKQIEEALRLHDPDIDDAGVRERTAELFEYVGINPERARQYPHEFSGGMRQRVMIALALACGPELIIGDEPTTALDVMMQAQILELLESLRDQFGLAMILIPMTCRCWPRRATASRSCTEGASPRSARSTSSTVTPSIRTRTGCSARSPRSGARASSRPRSPGCRPTRRCGRRGAASSPAAT